MPRASVIQEYGARGRAASNGMDRCGRQRLIVVNAEPQAKERLVTKSGHVSTSTVACVVESLKHPVNTFIGGVIPAVRTYVYCCDNMHIR